MSRRIGVVVKGIASRVVVIYRAGVVDGHPGRFVVRNVDHLGVPRPDPNSLVRAFHQLEVVAAQVAGEPGAFPKCGNRL